MDEGTQKVILSLASRFIGWFLGQGTNLSQKWWNNRKLKEALLKELEDIQHRVTMIEKGYARDLQIYAHGGVSMDISIKLSNPIYTKYYSDIFFKLKRAQRNSYEYIHGQIDVINKLIDKEADLISEFGKEKSLETLERYADLVKAQFQNVRILQWHIHFHLLNKDNPELGDLRSEVHREYLKFLDASNKEMYQIIEKAKKFNKADLEKIYNEKDFNLI